MRKLVSFFTLLLIFTSSIFSQAPKKPSSGEIYEAIQKLNFLGSVLYLAAHPDDENTRLISYFANDVKARTAYLSLTRGDGGQNLIGPEIRELLGVIRTQELLAARRTDGGEQFFTRANDFGYSKHPDETLEIWNEKEVLNDVVAVIRKFKPDIIINRFDHRTPGSTHGHHTSSAILSAEAFDLSANNTYKTHLENDAIWQPKRLFFNTSWWFYGSEKKFDEADKSKMIGIDIGTFYSQKGLSNSEIASLSRSKHQSQGFGSTGTRGKLKEYLEFLKGDFPKSKTPFSGINTTWSRVEGGEEIGAILKNVESNYDFKNPSASIKQLVKAYGLILNIKNEHWKAIKSKEIKNIISACAGLYMEATSSSSTVTPGSTSKIKIEAINRSSFSMNLKSVTINPLGLKKDYNARLANNNSQKFSLDVEIPITISSTSPYWLDKKGSLGMYSVANSKLIGKPETPRAVTAEFTVNFNGVLIPFTKEVVYKYNDPVKGEVYKPFEILPEVSASFEEKVYIFSNDDAQKISIKVKSQKKDLKGKLIFCLPNDWKVVPESYSIEIADKGDEQSFDFEVFPPKKQSEGLISPIVEVDGKSYTSELVEIDYNHIPFQSVVMPSEAKVVRLNIDKKGQLIGYIHGAGDLIPTSLRQIGYTVVEINENDITPDKLKNFDAIILGIRAYNTNERSKFYQKHLHNYVENGGTLIAQYNTSHRVKVANVGPYPIQLSRDRVTDEHSEVKILNPNHELLNFPNKITKGDFNGWVQERGLYFPNKWDDKYETIFGMNDKDETEKTGSLLVTKYGSGNFIYTGLSFFRELPAGVPGAYKLFANMLSVGKNEIEKPIKN
ncbi:N-acetylglucosaminyl deacetylase, LmbE family [Lutibacter oricola]|uniref:N-acetylglucosaminyl deacetylase, LmbE family n=1 Tax=Lutibacter oricola TaxID=762486 RepID=A0A1H3A5Z0_9FLAO|nr:PIG-L family deacetylase [Lutibacter oricola]SDX24871.1 N-acetylglucosaminyl deacetylase, LmbE family [Lutibacter oricola]